MNYLNLIISCLLLLFVSTVDAEINSASTTASSFKENNLQKKNGNWISQGVAVIVGKGNNSLKIAQITAESKAKLLILEHVCPGYDQSSINSVNISGLTTISSIKNNDSYEVILSAPIQKIKCEFESKNRGKLGSEGENQKLNKEKKNIDNDLNVIKNDKQNELQKVAPEIKIDQNTSLTESANTTKTGTPAVQKYDTEY